MKTSACTSLILALILSACVSVQLATKDAETAEGVTYKNPPATFDEISIEGSDKSWKNRSNGNIISYKSACRDNTLDSSIETITSNLLVGIENREIVLSKKREYSQREALETVIAGTLDGVKTQIHLMVFKKNFCTYSISYVALTKNFETNMGDFAQFLNSFEAP